MLSSKNNQVHAEDDKKNEEKAGFIAKVKAFFAKVKNFIHYIVEKFWETIGFRKPTANVTGIHISKINLERADIVFDLLAKNPTAVPIPLMNIDYLIDSDGKKLVSGSITDAGTIDAHGEETIKIPLSFIFDDIKSTYDDIKPGSIIPYKIKVGLTVDVRIFGKLTLPLEKTGEIPIPYQPEIDLEKIQFEKFSFEESVAVFHLKLENKNDFELGLNSMACEFRLSDLSIGGAQLSQSAKIDKTGISNIDIPITLRPKDFGSALWDMIREQDIHYSVEGHIEADTPFGVMKLPLSKEGGTTIHK